MENDLIVTAQPGEEESSSFPFTAEHQFKTKRQLEAYVIREKAAASVTNFNMPPEKQDPNDDPETESDEPTPYYAKYSKALKHDKNLPHNVVPDIYNCYLKALKEKRSEVFDALEKLAENMGVGPAPGKTLLTNPVGGLAFELEGFDPASIAMPAPPAYSSKEAGAEMAELYWMSLLRDIPFAELEGHSLFKDAIKDLSGYEYFRDKQLNEKTIFRAFIRGDHKPGEPGFKGVSTGPFISQFLLLGTDEKDKNGAIVTPATEGIVAIGSLRLSQRQRTVFSITQKSMDYLTRIEDWLAVQTGESRIGKDDFDFSNRYFIRNIRDLTNYVHFDKIYQEYLVAACILLAIVPRTGQLTQEGNTEQNPSEYGAAGSDILNMGNPYRFAKAQNGFATFGTTFITTLIAEVATRAHKAVWFQKWHVHRRLRPEEFGGQVHLRLKEGIKYPISEELLASAEKKEGVLNRINETHGAYFLPQAFPEGSPTHPSYGAGHATLAGAAVTILKGLFNEDFELPGAVQASKDGTKLEPVSLSEKLTIGGELNKLASNVSMARSMAGVHWRSDNTESLIFGERIAIELLRQKTIPGNSMPFYAEMHPHSSYKNKAPYFRLTKFDGTRIDIVNGDINVLSG